MANSLRIGIYTYCYSKKHAYHLVHTQVNWGIKVCGVVKRSSIGQSLRHTVKRELNRIRAYVWNSGDLFMGELQLRELLIISKEFISMSKKWHLLWIMGIGLAGNAFADSSPRIYFAQTGSFYKLFYNGRLNDQRNQPDAVASCQSQGGHLVTITSKVENDLLNRQIYGINSGGFWIGASDILKTGNWKWLTNEPWTYAAWDINQPSRDYSYAYFNPASTAGKWVSIHKDSVGMTINYVCEWELDYIQSSIQLGDITGDRVAELAVYKLAKGLRTVNIINPVTGASVSNLTFGAVTSIEKSLIAPVSDMNRNGKPEVALVVKNVSNGYNTVVIKDPINKAILNTFYATTTGNVDVLSMDSVPDLNRDGVSELQFLIKSPADGVGKLIFFNPKTGRILKTIKP